MTITRQPVIFVGHGSPMNAIGENRARKRWIELGQELARPRAIMAVSAHWVTEGRHIRTAADNPQVFDMYGFPDELYRVHYEPAGLPEVAEEAMRLVPNLTADDTWGIDHGVWSVLFNVFPKADVPVVMASCDMAASPQEQFDFGQALAPLCDEGVMVIASGNVVHNLRAVGWDMTDGYPWADGFDAAIKDAILARDFSAVVGYRSMGDAEKAVPTADHFYPLLTALGAALPDDDVAVFNDYRELGSMSMTSYLFSA